VRRRTGAGEDDIHSQANAVVRAARKREELVSLADNLESEIRDKLGEIKALEAASLYWKDNNKEYAAQLRNTHNKPSDTSALERDMTELTLVMNRKVRFLDKEQSELKSQEKTSQDLKNRASYFIAKCNKDEEQIGQLCASALILNTVFNHTFEKYLSAQQTSNYTLPTIHKSITELRKSCSDIGISFPVLFERLRQNLLIKGIAL
jgi:hypothetical protein